MDYMDKMPFRIVQISDMHLFADREKALLGVKTDESLRAVLSQVKQEKNIDMLFLSGDLSQDASEEAYIRVANYVSELNIPTYYIPGNHDDTNVMARVYPRGMLSNERHILIKDWQIILLDSHQHGRVEGRLDETQLNYLEQCLQAYPEHRAIIAFHHQPVLIGCGWLDVLGVTNADVFWKVVAKYPNVHTILFAHVHQTYENKAHGIPCYSPPSTCIQFKGKCDDFALEDIPPGYRWLELHADGSLKTEIRRVEKYVGQFDATAKGY